MSKELKLQMPSGLRFLLEKQARYKTAYGGRGAGKSWAYADSLIVESLKKKCRILCCREIQNSIKDSVHRLICDRISYYKLDKLFDITGPEIRNELGSIFIFKGLRTNVNEIKSLEGIDRCWIEEANKVTTESWELLIPTIRKDGSEIWISFNTGTESDAAYEMFVKSPRPDAITAKLNYYDNPWFPEVLKKDMEFDKKHNPSRFKHVWLGEPGGDEKFFLEFGDHLKEQPFNIEFSAAEGMLFGSLDSGTTHPTSFGLWWIEQISFVKYRIHRLFTYKEAGGTIKEHANEIYDRISSFPFTGGVFPECIVADPSMWTKVKLNEYMVRSPIDEYVDLFRERHKDTLFEKANNVKDNGCQIMRQLFKDVPDDMATIDMRYFDVYNKSFETGITSVDTDENRPEIYAKQDGDDIADESRYGLVKVYSVITGIRRQHKEEKPKTRLQKLLDGDFNQAKQESDWYDG